MDNVSSLVYVSIDPDTGQPRSLASLEASDTIASSLLPENVRASVTEIKVVQVNGLTGPNVLLRTAQISEAGDKLYTSQAEKDKLEDIEASATADQTDAEIETAYNNQVDQVTPAERTAGTETSVRRFSPADVSTMISIHGGGGGGGGGVTDHGNLLGLADDDHTQYILVDGTRAFTGPANLGGFNLSNVGTVDGRDLATDGTKLDGIESNATADQTGAEIKSAYEGEADTNAFTDAEKTKLTGIESNATADQTDAEIETGYNNQVAQVTAGERTAGTETSVRRFSPADVSAMIGIHGGGGGGGVTDHGALTGLSDDDHTQYTLADGTRSFTGPVNLGGFNLSNVGTVDGRDVSVDGTKLDGIESGATADQTGAEIKSAYEGEADTNAFTDAEKTKLTGIESNATADQTGAEIKSAYEGEADTNAFTDAEKTKLTGIESNATTDQTDAEIETAYNNQVDQVTPAERTAGTETAVRRFSPADVSSMISTHGGGGGGGVTDHGALTGLTDDDHTQYILVDGTRNFTGPVTIEYDSTSVPTLTLSGNDAGADAGPIIDLIRNSVSPLSGDYLGQIKFKGANSVGGSVVYSKITGKIQDPTSTSKDGLIEFAAQSNDTMTILARLTGNSGGALKLINGADLDLDSGNITLVGTVDGRDVSVDGAKLDTIESNATADQTGAEIKSAYEGEADTNAFTDAEKTKLTGIESNATADQTDAEIETAYNNQVAQVSAGERTAGTETAVRRFSPADVSAMIGIHGGSGGGGVTDHGALTGLTDDDHTQYTLADGTRAFTGPVNLGGFNLSNVGTVDGRDVSTDGTKLDGIESGATADQTGAEIKSAYEGEADTNAFTDAEKTKLTGIESNATADQTGAEIKSAYEGEADTNAFTDAEQTKLGNIEDNATADQTDAEIETAYNNQVSKVSAGEITAGTEVTVRRFSPKDVADIVAAHESASITDHGALGGLADDDHTQYHNDTRGDARYYTQSQVDTSLAGKADTSHTHTLSDITDAGSIASKDFWSGTQAQYDALGSTDANTLYFISG